MFDDLIDIVDLFLDDDYGITYDAWQKLKETMEKHAEHDVHEQMVETIDSHVVCTEGRCYYRGEGKKLV